MENNNFVILDSGEPDIKIKGGEQEILQLLLSTDMEDEVIDMYLQGKITMEILADETTLALKGYKTLYDKFSNSNKITGEVVKLNPSQFQNSINLFFLLFISLILGLIIEKI